MVKPTRASFYEPTSARARRRGGGFIPMPNARDLRMKDIVEWSIRLRVQYNVESKINLCATRLER